MTKRWKVALWVATAIALLVWLWPSPCPVELKFVGVEPSGVFDESENEYLLAQLEATNRDFVSVMVDDITNVELRIGGRWVDADQDLQFSEIRPNRTRDEELLIPAGTEACRLRLNYQSETRKFRLQARLGPRGLKWLTKVPWLAKNFWPDQYHGFSKPPKWRTTVVTLELPPACSVCRPPPAKPEA